VEVSASLAELEQFGQQLLLIPEIGPVEAVAWECTVRSLFQTYFALYGEVAEFSREFGVPFEELRLAVWVRLLVRRQAGVAYRVVPPRPELAEPFRFTYPGRRFESQSPERNASVGFCKTLHLLENLSLRHSESHSKSAGV